MPPLSAAPGDPKDQTTLSLQYRRAALQEASTLYLLYDEKTGGNSPVVAPPAPRDDGGEERSYQWKKLYPNGRIFGAGAKKQREEAERLGIDSLGAPSEVIVLRDVIDEGRQAGNKAKSNKFIIINSNGSLAEQEPEGSTARTSNIQAAIARDGQEPTEEEVNTSITELQPHSSVLEETAYNKLAHTLNIRYSIAQLSRYLSSTAPSKATAELSSPGSQVHEWQPGKTPIDKRRIASNLRSAHAKDRSKQQVITRILREAWSLTIHSEEQSIGELELHLKPWQLTLLFDLGSGPSDYITSNLLKRKSSILRYRADNILRITARRQDAEEVAQILQDKLRSVETLNLDLRNGKSSMLYEGVGTHKQRRLSEEEVKIVSQRARASVDWRPDDVLVFRAFNKRSVWDAQSLILQLLPLPEPSINEVVIAHDETARELPAVDEARLQRGAKPNADLVRLSVPAKKYTIEKAAAAETALPEQLERLAKRLPDHEKFLYSPKKLAGRRKENPNSYWRYLPHIQGWHAEFGLVLRDAGAVERGEKVHPNRQTIKAGSEGGCAVFQAQVPGTSTLLSNLIPESRASHDKTRTRLHTILIPSPTTPHDFDAMNAYPPRVEISFTLKRLTDGKSYLSLENVNAILREDFVNICLPQSATDMRLVRQVRLYADQSKIEQDRETQKFIQAVQESANSPREGVNRLEAPNKLTLRLPSWTMRRTDNSTLEAERMNTDEVRVEYLFRGFETTEHCDFIVPKSSSGSKIGPTVKTSMSKIEGHVVRLVNVEAGKIGGQRSGLSLVPITDARVTPVRSTLISAYALASLIDLANDGKLSTNGQTLPEQPVRHVEYAKGLSPVSAGRVSLQKIKARDSTLRRRALAQARYRLRSAGGFDVNESVQVTPSV